jgi:metal-responsive CopG/Arc/MetJ family transcriptional regulator
MIYYTYNKNEEVCIVNRINITIPDETLSKIDKMAKQENKSRSEFIRTVVQIYEKYKMEGKKRRENILKAIVIQDKLRKDTSSWDAISELRRQRDKNR